MGIEKGQSPIDLIGQEPIVEQVLRNHPKARESNQRVIAIVWNAYLGERLKHMTAMDLLTELAHGKLPKGSSLEKCCRTLKAAYPELRGKNHDDKIELEADVIVQCHQLEQERVTNKLLES